MDNPQNTIPYGFCQCGCGQKVPIARSNGNGRIKGQPCRYISGHNRTRGNWKGGKTIKGGYVRIYNPAHPRANHNGYVMEHILVLEKAFKRYISETESVHHIDENPLNNDIGNLMVFATHAMHLYFHQRLRAFKACGQWDWRKCKYCKQYDNPINLYIPPKGNEAFHYVCRNQSARYHYHLRKLNALVQNPAQKK